MIMLKNTLKKIQIIIYKYMEYSQIGIIIIIVIIFILLFSYNFMNNLLGFNNIHKHMVSIITYLQTFLLYILTNR